MSSTSTVPPAESNIRLPVAVSISPSFVPGPILTSPICASLNGFAVDPRYAPSSASGIIPVLTVTSPTSTDSEPT